VLLAIVKHFECAQRRLSVDPYAGWATVVRKFRGECEGGASLAWERIDAILEDVPIPQRSEAVQDLIAEHLAASWRRGRGFLLEQYVERFRDRHACVASLDNVPRDLIEDEFLARFAYPHGDAPSFEEYRSRFPGRLDGLRRIERRLLRDGRYVKIGQCGQGAMGIVHEAFDRKLGRRVAIKEPREDVVRNPALLAQFLDEARITAELEHPVIVAVHECDEERGRPYYVMRLASGQSFCDRIRDYHSPSVTRSARETRLLWNRLIETFASICEAIAFAHGRGVLHRDLKPANCIVGDLGEIALLDWGMAARANGPSGTAAADPGDARGGESSGMVVGTPQYMPPEQADGRSDVRSDVFGLGAILYEILTGSSPHAWPPGFRPADWLQKVRDAQFPKPRSLKPEIPKAIEAVCMKAIARKPDDRYAGVLALAQDVRRYLAGEPIAEAGAGSPWSRWVPRRSTSPLPTRP